jgi:hypothetical protein
MPSLLWILENERGKPLGVGRLGGANQANRPRSEDDDVSAETCKEAT